MDEFLKAYLNSILFAETDDNGLPLDHSYTLDDFAPEAVELARQDCEEFVGENWELIEGNLEEAGHNFWLARRGHGGDFRDSNYWTDDQAESLTASAQTFSPCYTNIIAGAIYLE